MKLLILLTALTLSGCTCPDGEIKEFTYNYRACTSGWKDICVRLGNSYEIKDGCVFGENGKFLCGTFSVKEISAFHTCKRLNTFNPFIQE